MADTIDRFSGGYTAWDEDWDEFKPKENKETKEERAQRILDELDGDEELMGKFNMLLRKKKLKQLKKNV